MKILFIRSLNPFYESTASGNRFAGIIKGLLENNVNVTLVITGGYNSLTEYKSNGRYVNYQNFSVHYTSLIFNNNIWLRRLNNYVIKDINKWINIHKIKNFFKQDFDYVFLTNNIDCLTAFNKNRNIINFKSVIELNEFTDIYKEHNLSPLQLNNAKKNEDVFLAAVKNIDCFAVMTKTLLAHYKSIAKPNAKFLHLPMTVDLSRFETTKSTERYHKPYIAYTGAFSNGKDGVDILIKAFKIISQNYPNIHLYLAGFYHNDVLGQKQLIEKYNLGNRITYLGVLNKNEIPEFISNACLLVLPRPDSHQAQGGFPTKLGEYLATGNPVCVTKVGEIPDYLVDNESAYMAIPGNIDSFADAMNRALSNKTEAIRIGLNGRKVANEIFNIEVQSKKLVNFLSNNLIIEKHNESDTLA